MRKLLLSTLAVLLTMTMGLTATAAMDGGLVSDQEEQKTEIKMEEVPSAVRDGWKEETTYAGSEVLVIYEVKTPSETYIEFVVKKDQEKVAVHFDLQGNLLREKTLSA